jgi:hypothetical protein
MGETMAGGRAPTARLRLTNCPTCGYPVDDPAGLHYVADDCVKVLQVAVADACQSATAWQAQSQWWSDQAAALGRERDALRREVTTLGARLALLRSWLGQAPRLLAFPEKEQL